jgi:hypothetical protein
MMLKGMPVVRRDCPGCANRPAIGQGRSGPCDVPAGQDRAAARQLSKATAVVAPQGL